MPFFRTPDPSPTTLDGKKRPILARAVAFVILVCVSLVAVEAWTSWRARDNWLRETASITSNMARALAQHADDTIRTADTILVGLVDRLEVEGMDAASLGRLHSFLRLQVAQLPQLHGLFVYDESGRWLVNSRETVAKGLNNADREYFVYHRTHADRGPHIGTPVRSRSTGDWILPVSRRLNHPDGSFAGVALATIRLAYFKDFYDSFDIGRAGAILLMTEDGFLVMRRPFNEAVLGMSAANGPVYLEYRTKGPAGTAMLKGRVDNVERLYSYRHLENYPLIVATALSREEILGKWRTDTYRIFIAIACLSGMLGLMGLRLIRQIRIREKMGVELRESKAALESLNRSLEQLALHDVLTGLANRRHFEVALENEFARARRQQSRLGLVMFDVDRFKQYNDRYGHPAGDECLRRIGQAIKGVLNRSGDLAARYGGEEFVVLLPATDLAGAQAVAERIRAAVQDLGIAHTANEGNVVTISAGVEACVPDREGMLPFGLVEAADRALYQAKSRGRNRVCSAGATSGERILPVA
ncbi:GGDEF domain-containing protein [Noviherbaspirillum massiliense]|uniref:GGDEF domain-containing protein n=1 Tax=Noviherbaspirillum massiliense TaxID=1465823 RepID=UPI0002EC2043|nr:sensor domain-containing diguanylate cyclase [Noviherbaspirillum massiliense]